MLKTESKILLIKDLARRSGVSVYTLKYYLKLGIIQESGRTPETNFRIFDENTTHRLAEIRKLQKEGFSLRQIKDRIMVSHP